MNGRVQVSKVGLDWQTFCPTHDESVWTYSWENAYQAAVGHACMYHPEHR